MSNPSSKNAVAFVLGLGVNGLGIVRSLGRKGIEVVGVYTKDNDLGKYSKYCKAIKFPQLKGEDDTQFLSRLVDLGESYPRKKVLFAESDLFVRFIALNRKMLDQHFVFEVPDAEMLDKKDQLELASEFGLNIPKTFMFPTIADFYRQLDNIPFPCLLKPCNSFAKIIDRKNLVFRSRSELIQFSESHPQVLADVIIQEIVGGGDGSVWYSTMYLDRQSDVLAIFIARKIRQCKPNFGVACFAESRCNPEIAEIAVPFLKKIKFTGLIGIEFKKDERENCYKFIEFNPRTHMANSHSLACNINLPYIAFMDLSGGICSEPKISEQRDSLKWIYMAFDWRSFCLKRAGKEITFLQWARSALQARAFAVFAKDDLSPWAYSIKLFIGKEIVRKFVRRLKGICAKLAKRAKSVFFSKDR